MVLVFLVFGFMLFFFNFFIFSRRAAQKQDLPLCLCRMEQNVDMVGAAEVVDDDLHETEATKALLPIAYEQGTIDEDLLLFTFAKDEDERKGRVVEASMYIPGACFSLDAQSDSSCLSMFHFTKAEIRCLCRLLQLPETTTTRNRKRSRKRPRKRPRCYTFQFCVA